MKVILFGSTGMIGQGVLSECLKDAGVESVLVINRQTCGITHPKLKEIIHTNLFDLSPISIGLAGFDACLFCVGVSSVGMKEADYNKMTYELTTKVAVTLLNLNKDMSFCYISGANTDNTENGNTMWARIKGKTENELLSMPFRSVYMFRPGYIQPMKGVKSKTRLYRVMYSFLKPLYFLIKNIDSMVTSSETLGKAMIIAASTGYEKKILESKDINAIVKQH
jgi:uncharacterized protein YbjT (DUF2867 family)